MKRRLHQLLNGTAWILAALLCAGCTVSANNPETGSVHAATQEKTENLQLQTVNPESDHVNDDAQEIQPEPGIEKIFNSELDKSSTYDEIRSLDETALTEGQQMLLALRMAEHDASLVDQAIERILTLKAKEHAISLDDIFDFHLGRLYAFKANKLSGDDASQMHQKAFDAFHRVLTYRKSPYYHLAYAEKMEQGIALNADITTELRRFIVTYPDYPELNAFKIALATREYESGMTEHAVETVQDLVFYYPWDSTAKSAQQWLDERKIEPKVRTFDEHFKRVDSLRKSRFWDDAQRAADEALPMFPESYQLMVQNARIAYERSHHEEAAKRFEDILEKLGGETKDKLRPAGVIAYLYRAYGYIGDRSKALEYFALNASKLGKNDRAKSTMEFAITCGALDVAYEYAKTVYADTEDPEELAKFGFIAYLNGDYENARMKFAMAQDGLSGTYKRRLNYFIAQATLKSALKQQKEAESAEKSDGSKAQVAVKAQETQTKSKKKSSRKKAKKKKTITLVPATVERAKSQFKDLIISDSDDYYAILAHSRLAELERKADEPAPDTPVIQKFGEISMNSEAKRPWNREFSYDEKRSLASFHENIEKFKSVVPELERVEFLHDAELYSERNALFRTLAIEILGISKMSKSPSEANLWTTKLSLDGHLVDNRKNKTGVWGCELDDYHFDLPAKKDKEAREVIAERQLAIYANASELKSFVRDTLVAFHDYYMARKQTPVPKTTCGDKSSIVDCSTLYPHAFSDAVISASVENQITPDIIWAVMNIESAFNPDSISHADAYGLLQIIPMTGYKIADAKQISHFGPYDLIRPENSISMGTWYFAQILKKFSGYATLSMAAYNGGPHQIARYMTAYAKNVEHDAFIELIPLNEARNYVKKGMARLLIFHRIDAEEPSAFFEIPNTLPESFEEFPNY